MPRIQLSTQHPNFCMPAALACLTGKTVDEAIELFKHELGDTPITRVYYPILLKILKDHGFDWEELTIPQANKFIGDMIVFVPGHVMVYDSILHKYYDPASPDGRDLPHYKLAGRCKVFAVRYPPIKEGNYIHEYPERVLREKMTNEDKKCSNCNGTGIAPDCPFTTQGVRVSFHL